MNGNSPFSRQQKHVQLIFITIAPKGFQLPQHCSRQPSQSRLRIFQADASKDPHGKRDQPVAQNAAPGRIFPVKAPAAPESAYPGGPSVPGIFSTHPPDCAGRRSLPVTIPLHAAIPLQDISFPQCPLYQAMAVLRAAPFPRLRSWVSTRQPGSLSRARKTGAKVSPLPSSTTSTGPS